MTKEILAKIENIDNDQVMTLRTSKKLYKIPVIVMVDMINQTVSKFGPIKEESIITFNMADNAYDHMIGLMEEYERQRIYSKVIPGNDKSKRIAK